MNFKDFINNQFLVWTLVLVPLLGVYSYFRLKFKKPIPPKKKRYRTTIAFQCLLLILCWMTTRENGFRFFENRGLSLWFWLLAVGWLLVVAIRLKSAWSRMTTDRKEKARRTLPENGAEMRYWIPISVLAGITEEWAYRGVACALLIRMTGSVVFSVLTCSVAFGLGHMFQGWRAVGGSALLAVALQMVAFQCESLNLVIAIHACYDLIVGTIAMRVLARDSATIVPIPEPVI
jgi:hypothetical protein